MEKLHTKCENTGRDTVGGCAVSTGINSNDNNKSWRKSWHINNDSKERSNLMGTVIDFDRERDLRYMGMEIPEHTKESLDRYFVRGWRPGGFCEAMLAQDYERAITIADQANRQQFWAIATWIRENAPPGSAGSYAAIDDWVADQNSVRSTFAQRAEKAYTWRTLKGE